MVSWLLPIPSICRSPAWLCHIYRLTCTQFFNRIAVAVRMRVYLLRERERERGLRRILHWLYFDRSIKWLCQLSYFKYFSSANVNTHTHNRIRGKVSENPMDDALLSILKASEQILLATRRYWCGGINATYPVNCFRYSFGIKSLLLSTMCWKRTQLCSWNTKQRKKNCARKNAGGGFGSTRRNGKSLKHTHKSEAKRANEYCRNGTKRVVKNQRTSHKKNMQTLWLFRV